MAVEFGLATKARAPVLGGLAPIIGSLNDAFALVRDLLRAASTRHTLPSIALLNHMYPRPNFSAHRCTRGLHLAPRNALQSAYAGRCACLPTQSRCWPCQLSFCDQHLT